MIKSPSSSNFQWFLKTKYVFQLSLTLPAILCLLVLLHFKVFLEKLLIQLGIVSKVSNEKKIMELGEGAWRLDSYHENEFSSLQLCFSRPPVSETPGRWLKNADSWSRLRPTDFDFLGVGHRNLYFEHVLLPTDVWGKTLPKFECKS